MQTFEICWFEFPLIRDDHTRPALPAARSHVLQHSSDNSVRPPLPPLLLAIRFLRKLRCLICHDREMPLVYRVDHDARIVLAVGSGIITHADVFAYQTDVWSRPDVAGYDELVDMSLVTDIVVQSGDRVRDLATLSATMDDKSTTSRFAIVAQTDVAFGLGRMYQTYRALDRRSTKDVGVFRTMREAQTFLGRDTPLVMPELP